MPIHSPLLASLTAIDNFVLLAYLAGMIGLGAYLSRRQRTEEEYFLAGRGMPWMAVGMSIIASLLSSLTYLSEPGEAWNSGVTHLTGKMLAIPIECAIVWTFCVPFMMRFKYTTAYEYLHDRFGIFPRRLGATLFIAMVVLWMGFVVLASARALSTVTGYSLLAVIVTVGVVATLYTVMGGLRAVIWTDVIQVVLLIGGGAFVIGYVAFETNTFLPDWYRAAEVHLAKAEQPHSLPWFSFDPTMRATVVTVALNMTVWHVCTHVANQMTVQRYFSTKDSVAARRSFLTGAVFSVGINILLVAVGLALLYFYTQTGATLDAGLDPAQKSDRDLIFPTFAVSRLPAGFGGAILAALLAAAMSSIDSGVNSIATVVAIEKSATAEKPTSDRGEPGGRVREAQIITLIAGLFITIAAYCLSYLPSEWGIVDAMPRTFNAITAPLGGMFLVGMFIPRAGAKAVVAATFLALTVSVSLGYLKQIGVLLVDSGLLSAPLPSISFTWIMPASLLTSIVSAALLSLLWPATDEQRRRSYFAKGYAKS
ncbi:MAG: sodium/solute symporter [Pirellulaceae bacterium]|nr:sodium/solute symporter [Pirellulaceae bacterium]